MNLLQNDVTLPRSRSQNLAGSYCIIDFQCFGAQSRHDALPISMPGLVRKLVIFAAVDGLVLQPLAQRNQQRPIAPVKIDYKSHAVSPSLRDDGTESNKTSLEAYGIIGNI